jgi:uncharacterized membrane protein YozB (DUF420 family)
MNIYLLIGTVSLAFQIGVLVLLAIGFEFKRRSQFRNHGITMMTALISHFVIIGGIMVPSFIAIMFEKPASLIGFFAPFHAVAGLVTAILGIWIVGGWRLRQSIQYCAPKRKFMRITLVLWSITLSLGVVFYFILNWSSLFS